MTPQAAIVLKHLQQAGSISNVEAHAVLKVRSVSRRITEIVKAGYIIRKELKKDTTGQRYVRYVYEAQNDIRRLPVVTHPVVDFTRTLFRETARAAA